MENENNPSYLADRAVHQLTTQERSQKGMFFYYDFRIGCFARLDRAYSINQTTAEELPKNGAGPCRGILFRLTYLM